MLVNCQSGEILEQIYNECEETVFIDKVGIERALKKNMQNYIMKDYLE